MPFIRKYPGARDLLNEVNGRLEKIKETTIKNENNILSRKISGEMGIMHSSGIFLKMGRT